MDVHLVLTVTRPVVDALQLVLARRRGPVEVLGTFPKARCIRSERRTLLVVLEEPLASGTAITLALRYAGDAVRIVAREERRLSAGELAATEASPADLGFRRAETPVDEIFRWRAARASAPFAAAKRFFNALDEATWVVDAEQDGVRALLESLLAARRAGAGGAAIAALEQGASVASLQRFSDVFRACIQAEFGDPATSVEAVADAFDRFAAGELSLLDATDSASDAGFAEYKAQACQPDSGFYLYFAEFAGLCAQKGIAGVPWPELLPALVQTQATFFDAYRLPGGDPIPLGTPLGGKWPPAVPRSSHDLHQARASFEASYAAVLDDVRANFAQQFVEL